MILYHVDSNSIWVEPTKNKTKGEHILARSQSLLSMKACSITPWYQVLDNEISAAYKNAITASGMTYQLVPPDDHLHNTAEKSNSNMEESRFNTQWHCWRFLSPPLVSTHPADGASNKFITTITQQSNDIVLHAPIWPPWLQLSPFCSYGNGSICPWQTSPPKIIRTTLHERVCFRHLNRSLLLLDCVDTCLPYNTHLGDSIF